MRIYLKADYHKRFKKKKRWLRIHEIKDKKRGGGREKTSIILLILNKVKFKIKKKKTRTQRVVFFILA